MQRLGSAATARLVHAASSRALASNARLAQLTLVDGSPQQGPRSGDTGSSLAGWWKQAASDSSPRSAWVSPELARRLSEELEVQADLLRPQQEQLDQLDDFLQRLQGLIDQTVEGAKVLKFGSAANGLWTAHSDVDVCVRVPRASTRATQVKTLRDIAALLSKVESYQVEPRYGAEVPILHWAPRRPGMVTCDISVNNTLAVVNSRLLRRYVRLDDRLRTLGFCLKAWAQARGINDRSRGTISSFSLVLMLIHFLQRRDPPVLPSLQDIAFSRSLPPDYINGIDCRFCSDDVLIQAELDYLRGGQPADRESTGHLMLDFFRHFGHEYRHGIIRVRDTRSQLPPRNEAGCYLIVDNPFEVGKDVANVDAAQHAVIRKEFRRAWTLLKEGRSFRELVRDPNLGDAIAGQRYG